jgi:hypothetical protein
MGSGWAAGIKMRDYSSRLRQKDHLISPPFFKSAAPWGQSYRLSFDVAYANRNSTFRDSLWVELSDNCGQNYRIIYRNGGDSLRSHALINPADSSAFRRIFVDDSLLQQNISGSYRLRFTSLNDFGGNLYVTNIALYRVFAASSSNLGDSDARKSRWIYPNPSQTRELNYRTGSEVKGVRLTLINATGQTLWTSEITESLQGPDFRWELPNLDKGIYTVLMDEFNYHNLTTPRSFRFRLVHATP